MDASLDDRQSITAYSDTMRPVAEPKIDYFINRYFATVAWNRQNAPNTFDYEVVNCEVNRDTINSFHFRDILEVIENGRQNQHFRKNVVYPMFMHRGSGSISFKPTCNSAFEEVSEDLSGVGA